MLRLIVLLTLAYFMYRYLTVQKVAPNCSKCGKKQAYYGNPVFRPPRGVPPYYAP